MGMGQLGLVERHNHAQNANSETSDGAAGIEIRQRLGAGLQSTAEAENESADQDGPATAELVTHGAGGTGAEEGTAREDGHDCCCLIVGRAELGIEGMRGNDLGNDTQVVAVEQRPERGEDADQELVPLGGERHGGGSERRMWKLSSSSSSSSSAHSDRS